jgi:hypothetical protein
MKVFHKLIVSVWLLISWINVGLGIAAEAARSPEWNKAVEEAKKEGKIVLAIPPATELRAALEPLLKQKFGLDAELISASGPKNASRIAAEKQAGVSYFDALICGTGTAAGLTHDGMLEPMESFWLLPEVRDPKQWWGGHIWEDNVNTNRFLYSFLADVSTQSTWYNTTLAKPQELRTFEDYLNPKWKGRIGFSDPRVPSSGQSIWSFMWENRGEEYAQAEGQGEQGKQCAAVGSHGTSVLDAGDTASTQCKDVSAWLSTKRGAGMDSVARARRL